MQLIKAPYKYYSEEHQEHPVKFSWVNRDGDVLTELFAPVQCKEFITDIVLWHKHNINGSIYGFSYSKEFRNDPYMCITFPTVKSKDAFLTNVGMFGTIGWRSDVMYQDKEHVVMELDPEWLKTSWRISLWTIIAKAAAWKRDKTKETLWDMSNNEKKHLSVAEVKFPGLFDKIITNLRDIPIGGYDELVDTEDRYRNHENQGFWNTFVYRKGITGNTYKELLKLKGE